MICMHCPFFERVDLGEPWEKDKVRPGRCRVIGKNEIMGGLITGKAYCFVSGRDRWRKLFGIRRTTEDLRRAVLKKIDNHTNELKKLLDEVQ